MNSERDQHDERLEANLRRVAGSLSLPDAPDAARMRSWKAAKAAPTAPLRETGVLGSIGVFVMAKRNWIAGVAAVLAVSAAMWPFAGRSSVQAKTIVASLRSTTFESVRVSLKDVEAQGVLASGELLVRFSKPITMSQVIDDGEQVDATVSAAYAKLHARSAGKTHIPAFDVQVEAASSPENTWVYGRADLESGGMKELREALPPVAGMLESGVLINFGAINLNDFLDEGDRAEIKEGLKEARAEMRQEAGKNGGKGDDQGKKIELMVSRLLSGKATAENLQEIKKMLDEASLEAKVEDQGGGRHLLTTGRIGHAIRKANGDEKGDAADKGDGHGKKRRANKKVEIDDDGQELLDAAVLKVMYAEEKGVEWLEVSELGEKHGSIRVEFSDAKVDPALLDSARLVKAGKTSVLNFDAIKALMGER